MEERQALSDYADSDSVRAITVGERIQQRRLKLGLTQAEVADGMLSPSYVSLVESGRRQPAASALEHIAERLGVDADYLRDGIDADVRARARLALGHAEIALRQGESDDAHQRFVALEGEPGLSEQQQRRVRIGRARAAELRGDLEEALHILGDLAEQARRDPGAEPWMDVAAALCRCYREAGDLDMSVQVGDEAMRTAADHGLEGSDEYVRLGCTVLMAYYERGDLARATVIADELIRGAEAFGAPHTRGAAYWNAAIIAESRGQVGEALALVDRAQALFGESDDHRNLSRLKVTYAWLLLQQQPPEAERAMAVLDDVHDAVRTYGGAVDVGYRDTERARALLALGKLDEARDAAEASLAMLGDQPRIEAARARLLLGQILRAQKLTDECLAQCTVAAAMLESMGATRQAASAWRELGDLYRDLGRTDSAIDAFDRALRAVRVAPAAGVGAIGPVVPEEAELAVR